MTTTMVASTVTLVVPKFWLLVKPCGCVDGSLVSVRIDGTVCATSAEDAWRRFTPNKRARDKEAREGMTCRGITDEEMPRFKEMLTAKCAHEVTA